MKNIIRQFSFIVYLEKKHFTQGFPVPVIITMVLQPLIYSKIQFFVFLVGY